MDNSNLRAKINQSMNKISTLPCAYCMEYYGQKEFDCKGCNLISYCTKEHKEKDKNRHKCSSIKEVGMGPEKYLRLKEQLSHTLDTKYFDMFFINLDRCNVNHTFLIQFLPNGNTRVGFVRYNEPHEESDKKGIKGLQCLYYAGFPDAYMCGFLFIDVIAKRIVSCIDNQSDRPDEVKTVNDMMNFKLR